MDFGVAITLGLLGSLHCAAMCGPLQMALPVHPGGARRLVSGRLIYQLGRILTYCLLGLIGGTVGKSLVLAGVQRWLSISLGIAIFAGFLLSKKASLSSPVVRAVGRLKEAMAFQLQRRSQISQAILGMLNGFLPCGLVYVALAGAVSQGAILPGVLFMAAFGLGTAPTLLAIGLSGRLLPLSFRLKLRSAIPLGVCSLAVLLILRGMSLGIPYISPALTGAHMSCCPAP